MGPTYTEQVQLAAPAATVWRAITDPAIVDTYYLAPLAKLELHAGGAIVYGSPEQPLIAGEVIEVVPDRKLVHSFAFDPVTHAGVTPDRASRVTYTLETVDGATVLTLIHDGFGEDGQTYANVTEGWPIILSGLRERVNAGIDTARRP